MAPQPEVVTSVFPQDLPPRPQPIAQKSQWKIRLSSYSLRHLPDARTRWRRIAMWTIILFRLGLSVFAILWAVALQIWAEVVIFSILAAVGFYLVALPLQTIGDATGERRLGRMLIVSAVIAIFMREIFMC